MLEPCDLGPHLHPELRVEVRERLVHQERLRLPDDRAPHRDPLALPSRERSRLALEERLEIEHLGRILDPAVDLALRDLLHPQPEGDVLVDREVWVQGVALEDHRDVPVTRRDVVDDAVADAQHAPRDLLEAGHHPERCRLPAPRRADEHHEL